MESASRVPPLRVVIDGDRATIHVSDETLSGDAGTSCKHLPDVIDGLAQQEVALNFENVRFLSSLGLAKLVAIHKRLQASGRRLALTNVEPHVYEVFAVTRLTTLFQVHQKKSA